MHPTDHPVMPDTPTTSTGSTSDEPYVVVWNDAVDLRQLAIAIVICVGIGLPSFLGARAPFTSMLGTPALAGGYALLVGLIGCVAAATICAKLFRPKRTFHAGEGSPDGSSTDEGADHAAALAELERMGGTAEAFIELPLRVQAEMTELGLAPLSTARPARGDILDDAEAGTEAVR
jgi:hypothetical protein